MQNEKRETTFSLTNKYECSWLFTGHNYCIKGERSYISLFYSHIEDLWAIVSISGWTKVNGRVVESIVYIKNNCVIDFENISYIFTSHKSTGNGCSKAISSTISSSDRKKISQTQVMYYLKNIKMFIEAEANAVYKILQQNSIFVVKDNLWELDYYQYGLYRHHLISDVLLNEYHMRMSSENGFKLFGTVQNIESTSDAILKGENSLTNEITVIDCDLKTFHSENDLLKYISLEDRNSKFHNSWIGVFFQFSDQKSSQKRKIEMEESPKKKCLYKIEDLNAEKHINYLTEHSEVEKLRNSFTADITERRYSRGKKVQRSYSLIEEHDKDSENIWIFERKSKDDTHNNKKW
ncbi:hypothetical protein NGRA_0388 [Nosema granulosis]|uniref:Uncharacterized protein n=1 Tax=Nosema granulosis TaxID=83296 RepID=A0A9P6H0F5_9MICR|nr:hypothetical protein NGRA_0388 [Nosema granulosis]